MDDRLIRFDLIDFLVVVVIVENREAAVIQDVRLVVRQGGGRPLEPIFSNDERLSIPKKHISSRLGWCLLEFIVSVYVALV